MLQGVFLGSRTSNEPRSPTWEEKKKRNNDTTEESLEKGRRGDPERREALEALEKRPGEEGLQKALKNRGGSVRDPCTYICTYCIVNPRRIWGNLGVHSLSFSHPIHYYPIIIQRLLSVTAVQRHRITHHAASHDTAYFLTFTTMIVSIARSVFQCRVYCE